MAEHDMSWRIGRVAVGFTLVLAVAACGKSRPVQPNEYGGNPQEWLAKGTLSGNDGTIFSTVRGSSQKDQGAGLGVNAYLWRGALDTLSFMPLSSADPFGGVIITDWYQPPAAGGERFKATAYILGRQLRADGVKVSIFRQVLQNGQWMDAPVNPATATEIENKILVRARELRTNS